MKISIIKIIILITIFLNFFPTISFAEKRTYNIGILLEEINTEVEPLLEKLKKEIKTVVGEDANIEFPAELQIQTKNDFQKVRESYIKLVSEADLIIAFGVYNSTMVNQQVDHVKPTIVVDRFTSKVSGIDKENKTSGKHNLTYVVFSNSFEKDFDQFKKIYDFKNVGIVVEKPLLEILDFNSMFSDVLSNADSSFKIIPYENSE